MIIPTGGVDKVLGANLQRTNKTTATDTIERMSRGDVVRISRFSALVELGRARALALPEVRDDLVTKAQQALESGNLPGGADIAGSMINSAAEGQV